MNAEKYTGGILNLTQHTPTKEQKEDGVYDPVAATALEVKHLLTFSEIPLRSEVVRRARRLAAIARHEPCLRAMIGGAPFLMSELERELAYAGVTPLYAFSVRQSAEETQPDGTVRKTSRFCYIGLYVADMELGGTAQTPTNPNGNPN